jgi:phosphatidylglycerol:prolipoprotein diacylglycerol transferase
MAALCHLAGPLSIHAYGVCIALGILIAFYLLGQDKKLQKMISHDDLGNMLQYTIVAGYLGGRLLFLIPQAQSSADYWMLLQFWQPGLSILGCVLGVFVVLLWFVRSRDLPALQFLDRLVICAPLVQTFGRLGCFFAGCCFGLPCAVPWAIMYTNTESMAPLFLSLHPTQLYSAGILLSIFLFFYLFLQYRVKTPGVLLCSYVIFIGTERFLIDFFRWDTIFFSNVLFNLFSVHQWIALAMVISACLGLVLIKLKESA